MAQHRTYTRRQSTVTKQSHTPPSGPDPKDSDKEPRRVGLGKYKSFRLQKRSLAPAYEDRGVPGGLRLLKRSIRLCFKHWKLLGGITLIFGVINLILAGGSLSANSFENTLNGLVDPNGTMQAEGADGDTPAPPLPELSTTASTGLTLIGLLISTGGGNGVTEATTTFQLLLFLLASLAIIWSLRRIYAGQKASIRGAWYFGTASLVPFFLVLMVILLEFIPMAIGSYIVYNLIGQGITVNFLENALTLITFVLLATITCYWVSGSIFALQIVTLEDMTPIKALRTSHELVKYRRALVLRRLFVFGLVFLLISIFFVVPLSFTYTPAAPPAFFILMMISVTVFHAYLYDLYRELIG